MFADLRSKCHFCIQLASCLSTHLHDRHGCTNVTDYFVLDRVQMHSEVLYRRGLVWANLYSGCECCSVVSLPMRVSTYESSCKYPASHVLFTGGALGQVVAAPPPPPAPGPAAGHQRSAVPPYRPPHQQRAMQAGH